MDKHFIQGNQADEKKKIEENNVCVIITSGNYVKNCHNLYGQIAFQVIPIGVFSTKNIACTIIAIVKQVFSK
jgi:hypothetical protein